MPNIDEFFAHNSIPKKRSIDVYIGARLKYARECENMSLNSLGTELGLDQVSVLNFENGDLRIKSADLFRISKVLGINIGFFFK